MARINIEDDFFLEVIQVAAKMGNPDEAIGNAIRFFRFAQEKHRTGRQITEEEFKDQGFSEALIPTFAKRTRSGIEAKGAKKHFAWLSQKIEAGKSGGKKSADSRRKSGGTAQPRKGSNRKQLEAKPSDAEPSPSSSSSSSLSSSQISLAGAAPPASREEPSAIALTWRAYKAAYEKRWGQSPAWSAELAGQFKSFCQKVPAAEAPSIAEFFVSHPKTLYSESMSAVGLLLRDAQAIRTQWLNRTPLTDSMVKEYRQKASQPREKGIAEIMAERGQPIEPRLVSGGEYDPV